MLLLEYQTRWRNRRGITATRVYNKTITKTQTSLSFTLWMSDFLFYIIDKQREPRVGRAFARDLSSRSVHFRFWIAMENLVTLFLYCIFLHIHQELQNVLGPTWALWGPRSPPFQILNVYENHVTLFFFIVHLYTYGKNQSVLGH